MINTAGAYLLILVYASIGGVGGITTADAENFDACKAMVKQVEPIRGVTGYCIAATVFPEQGENDD